MADKFKMKISMEAQLPDNLRNEMKQQIWDQFSKSVHGAMNDIYRRVFEQGWFSKDVFDGRWAWDTHQMGQGQQQGRQGQDPLVRTLRQGYGPQQQFYGMDQQANGMQPPQQAQERDKGQERDMDIGL
jgi:hypothetical protein